MQRTQFTPSISPNNHFHVPIYGVKFSPLHMPSRAPGLKSSKWGLISKRSRQHVSTSFSRKPEIVCLFDGLGKIFGEDAKDAARKAFEKAQEGKDKAFRMWKEVSGKTARDMAQEDDGDDDGFGGGRYGGWGGSGNPEDEDDWKETFVASMLLLLLYMKMRGTRWTRDGVPFTDYDILVSWYQILFKRVQGRIEGTIFIFKLGCAWAKLYLHRLRKRPLTAASSTSTY